MAYVEVRKRGKLLTRRFVDDDRAYKGCRIRVGSAGQVHLRTGESKTVGKYEITMFEGMPPDDEHEVVSQFGMESGSFPAMSETEEAEFTGPPQAQHMGRKAPVPTIEGYEITGRLGRGGMGTVWRAVELSTKREVALKFLGRHRFASKRSRARFEREVALAAKLTHPNIARVYHSDLYKGVYYYAMELVDGIHLDKYVQQNQLSQREILELMKNVCDAVGHAHEKGIIHRDLKPSNILVTKDGRPHVVDFGLAKASMKEEDDVTISIDGEVTGTLAYMSPEQAAGRLDKIGEPTDVYSLGVILHQLLTGRLPHDVSGSRYDVVKRIVEEDVQSPRAYDDSVDSDLESLILTALAQDLEDRYPSAVVLLQDLENYLKGEPLLARSMSATYRIRKRFRKYVKQIAKTLLPVMVVAVIIVIAYCLVISERRKRIEAERLAGLRTESVTEQAKRSHPSETPPSPRQRKTSVEGDHSSASEGDKPIQQPPLEGTLPWLPRRAHAPAAIQVDGKPCFVICARSCDPHQFAEVAAAGFNTVSYVYHDKAEPYLSAAKEHGLKAIVYTGQNPNWDAFQADISSLRNDPALLAWLIQACPLWHNIPVSKLRQAYDLIHRLDNTHPVELLFYPTKQNWPRARSFLSCCNIVAIEPYPYWSNASVLGGLSLRDKILAVPHWTDQAIRDTHEKPLWVLIQAHMRKDGQKPSPQQFRAMTYLAINHGASGVFFAGYRRRLWEAEGAKDVIGLGDPQMYKLRQETLRVAGEIGRLSPAILAGPVLDEVTITNDNGIIDFKAYLHPDNKRLYIVAVNTSKTEVKSTFKIPGFVQSKINLLGETRQIAVKNGHFTDTLEPYQTQVYVLRIPDDVRSRSNDSVEDGNNQRANISEIIDPKDNLRGNSQKAYLDIVKASVFEEGENCVFTVTMADDFPTPSQLGDDDKFTFIWFIDIDRNKATGQGRSGNDYNIHLWCSNKNAWYTSWFKTTDTSKKDGITIQRKKITIHIADNTATLTFPKNYLPSDQFDWWVNTGTRPHIGPSAASNPPTQRGTFKRPLSGKQAILLGSFDSNQPLTSPLFPGIMWRANTGEGQSVSTCQIDHHNGACGTSSSVKWSYQIQGTWVNLALQLSGSNWKTPVDLSMYDAISFYIKGTGTRGCRLKFQTAPFDGKQLINKVIPLDVNTHWKKIEVPLKNNPKLDGLNFRRTHTMGFVDSPPESASKVVWIDQIYLHIKQE